MKNVAVIVTFNKKDLLKECIEALLNQTVPLDCILVFNNASDDGTTEFLQGIASNILCPIHSDKNLGGAGGFNQAIKEAMKLCPSAVWVMDDDSIVERNALEKLVEAKSYLKNEFGFLSSNVLWTDNQPCVMNIPKPDKTWNHLLNQGLIKIKTASFVSMYINANAIRKIGYPIADFFIWGDDVEYSDRISDIAPCYLVSSSEVIHKMQENSEVDIMNDNKNRIPRYYYDIRNKFYRYKKKGMKDFCKYVARTFFLIFKIIFSSTNYKSIKVKTILKGFLSGIFFNPTVETYENDSL